MQITTNLLSHSQNKNRIFEIELNTIWKCVFRWILFIKSLYFEAICELFEINSESKYFEFKSTTRDFLNQTLVIFNYYSFLHTLNFTKQFTYTGICFHKANSHKGAPFYGCINLKRKNTLKKAQRLSRWNYLIKANGKQSN